MYSDFSLQHGLIGRAEKKAVDEQYALCEEALDGGDPRGANASQVCNQVMNMVLEAAGNINVYDMQKSCDTALCYPGIADVKTYLDQPAVLKALNVAPWFTQWTSCNNSVYGPIATPDWYNQEEYTVPVLLDSIRILIYAGRNDFICNHASNYAWVSDMDWNLKGEWNAAPHKVWSSADGKTVKGYVQAYGPLSFVSVTAAGHMVTNQPIGIPLFLHWLILSLGAPRPAAERLGNVLRLSQRHSVAQPPRKQETSPQINEVCVSASIKRVRRILASRICDTSLGEAISGGWLVRPSFLPIRIMQAFRSCPTTSIRIHSFESYCR